MGQDDAGQGNRTGETLARLDERTLQIAAQVTQLMAQLNANFVSQAEFKPVKASLEDMVKSVPGSYVTQAEFTPVRNAVYGMIGLIVITVLGSLVALVMRKGP